MARCLMQNSHGVDSDLKSDDFVFVSPTVSESGVRENVSGRHFTISLVLLTISRQR